MQRYEDTVSRVDTRIGSYTEYRMKKSEQGSYVLYDDAQSEIARLTRERDEALAQAAAAAVEMRRLAADSAEDYCSDMPDLAGHGHSVGIKDSIHALPIPTDAQEALDRLLEEARQQGDYYEGIQEGYKQGIKSAAKVCDWGDIYGDNAVRTILALLNDGGRDE